MTTTTTAYLAFVRALAGAALVLLIPTSNAFAQNTFTYEAEVTSVFGPHSATLSSGDKVNISYTLNPAVADTNADPKLGLFPGAVTGMSVSFPGRSISVTAGAAGNAQTFDNFGTTFLSDQVFFFGGPISSPGSLGGQAIDGLEVDFGTNSVAAPAVPTMLSSDALPLFKLPTIQATLFIHTASGWTQVNFTVGGIGGKVTGVGGAGVSGVNVTIYNASGSFVTGVTTGTTGGYRTSGVLPTGTYFARTFNSAGYIDELYKDLLCGDFCTVTTGTAISVVAGVPTNNIDFALTLGGSISGTVTGAGGVGLSGAFVQIYDGDGTFVDSASTNATGQYTVNGLQTGTYFAWTFNSAGYINELYNDLACVSFCDTTTGTPIAVTAGATTSGINFALTLGGSISGSVTGQGGGGLADVSVQIYDAEGSFVTLGFTAANGQYTAGGLPAGTYFARTFNSDGYIDELYNNLLCRGFCDVTTGTPIAVTAGSTTNGIHFALTLGGSISGVVTGQGGGGLANVSVQIYDASGSFAAFTSTAANGQYTAGGLTTGTYFARTFNSNGYFDELYNNLPCVSFCVETTGTPIAVTAGTTTSGINFALELGGRISGTVTGPGGVALADVEVDIYDATGSFVTYGFTNATGQYISGAGLPSGTYFAQTFNFNGYIDELYNNINCVAGVCDVTAGTPIGVTVGVTTGGVNFALAVGGRISGTVTGPGGVALTDVEVDIYDATGSFVTYAFTNATGQYISRAGLPSGTYFAQTFNFNGYIDELYNNITCVAGRCDVTAGAPIGVTVGATTSGVNFALAVGGRISGTVTGPGGVALEDVQVSIYDTTGSFVTYGYTNANGQYISGSGLLSGTYFARTANFDGYIDELYNNITCVAGGCDVTAGAPIAVTVGATTSGVNFALAVGGRISGTVTGPGGLGLSNISVRIYNTSGSLLTTGFTNGSGQYISSSGLPTGTYFARTDNSSGYVDELYNNVPCTGGSCEEITGTPIAVTAGQTTGGVNFSLVKGGGISGTVTGTGGVGLDDVNVRIYAADGSQVTSRLTNATGQYSTTTGLPTGTYFARTSNSVGYIDELYNNLPCPNGACNETTGTPITVTAGSTTTGINFALASAPVGTVTTTPTTLNFAGTNTGGVLNPITPPQTVTVTFSGAGAATWSAAANQPWVQLTGASGTGSGTFTVGIINPGGILPTNVLSGQATLSATITLTAPTVTNSPQTVTVNLSLQPATTFAAPIGLVDTPLQNASSVVGAIAVTGWVVDDVGIANVQLYRNCLAFEPAINCQLINGQNVVFIGNATLVPGARPDIEALYPTYPSANVGAWGYLLLTSMLPHIPNGQMFGGQGPLTLYIFATDADGHVKQLGRTQFDTTPTQITMSNDTITKPFGAIDTPGQGATISGAAYANFGWSLTPDGNTVADAGDILVPTNGSTMSVLIDGAPVGAVSFNQCRGTVLGPVPGGVFCDDDVSSIFGNPTPQATFTPRTSNPTRHRNLDAGRGPIGAYILNTTTLTNGIHTIMWVVFDDAGRGEGIGSRFFTVLNGSSLTTNDLSTVATTTLGTADQLTASPVDAGVMWARQGFNTPPEELLPDATGRRTARMSAQGRLEVALGGGVQTGYLVANGTLRALPPGSKLNPATGLFTWHPVLGYLGTYELTFLRENGTQVPLTVTLEPDGMAAGHIEMALDRPAVTTTVSGAFTVEGWALDTGAWQGAGIGAVHVWAQRVDTPAVAPQFLGAATFNGARHDVAAIYGSQFERVGYALSVPGLAPGTYDVTAYVWRTSTQQFEDARAVRITVR